MKTTVHLNEGAAIVAEAESVQIQPAFIVVNEAETSGTIRWIPWSAIRYVRTQGITAEDIERQKSAQRQAEMQQQAQAVPIDLSALRGR